MMRSIRKRDTRPELIVRRVLRELGYGYTLHAKDLPGSPDIVLRGRRKVILVHGCFWHQHQDCALAKRPSARPEYWLPKFSRNKERDRAVADALGALGWNILVIWECTLDDEASLKTQLQTFCGGPAKSEPREAAL